MVTTYCSYALKQKIKKEIQLTNSAEYFLFNDAFWTAFLAHHRSRSAETASQQSGSHFFRRISLRLHDAASTNELSEYRQKLFAWHMLEKVKL